MHTPPHTHTHTFSDAACQTPVPAARVTRVSYPTTCYNLAFLGAPTCWALGTLYPLQSPGGREAIVATEYDSATCTNAVQVRAICMYCSSGIGYWVWVGWAGI